MAFLIICWGLLSILGGERLPCNEGFSSDGLIYRNITMNLWKPNSEVTMYHGMRCLPCVVIRYTLKALRLSVDGTHIYEAFRLYNMFLLVVILVTLLAIGDELSIGLRGKWLIFLGFCCSYFGMKQHYYSPGLTDLWALAFASLALLCHFKQRLAGVFCWTLLGSFTWAIMPYFGGLLILFPFKKRDFLAPQQESARGTRLFAAGAAALAAAVVLGYTAYLVWKMKYFGSPPGDVIYALLPLSLACVTLYLFFALKELLNGDSHPRWRDVASLSFLRRLGALASLFVVLAVASLVLRRFFTLQQHNPSFWRIPNSICVWAVAKPFLSLLTQIVYYGPVVILMALFWRRLSRQAHVYGTAIVLETILGLLLSLATEPRFCLLFFPLFLVLLAKVLEDQALGFSRQAGLAALALFLSKAWLPLNWGPWPPGLPYGKVFHIPMQAFYMNYGIWMNDLTYAIQGSVIVASALLIKYVLLPRPAVIAQARTAARLAA
jgi:hypothetical protein